MTGHSNIPGYSVIPLRYGNTNTYLIKGDKGYVLFDTAWAGTFNLFCGALKETGAGIGDIRYLLISHFHPDHMGIAQEIASHGVTIVIPDVQKAYIHSSDHIFEKEGRTDYTPIDERSVRMVELSEGRKLLAELGIDGEIIHTPGHSDDSISLWLDEGCLLVGDLNPLYELELHRGTQTGASWDRLLAFKPKRIYYGHAKPAVLEGVTDNAGDIMYAGRTETRSADIHMDLDTCTKGRNRTDELYAVVKTMMRMTDKGRSIDAIVKKTGADRDFTEDVVRMYLTHRDVGVQGILDRIEIKGR